jgi:hypothetical protein
MADRLTTAKFDAFVALQQLETAAAELTAIDLEQITAFRTLLQNVDAKLLKCEAILTVEAR